MHLHQTGTATADEIRDAVRRYAFPIMRLGSSLGQDLWYLAHVVTSVEVDDVMFDSLHVEADRMLACGDPRGEVLALALGPWANGDLRGTAGAVRWLEWLCAARDLDRVHQDALVKSYGYPRGVARVKDGHLMFLRFVDGCIQPLMPVTAWERGTVQVSRPVCVYEASAQADFVQVSVSCSAEGVAGLVLEIDGAVVAQHRITSEAWQACGGTFALDPARVSHVRVIAGVP